MSAKKAPATSSVDSVAKAPVKKPEQVARMLYVNRLNKMRDTALKCDGSAFSRLERLRSWDIDGKIKDAFSKRKKALADKYAQDSRNLEEELERTLKK